MWHSTLFEDRSTKVGIQTQFDPYFSKSMLAIQKVYMDPDLAHKDPEQLFGMIYIIYVQICI